MELGAAIANYAELLIASRHLQFFTSISRWIHDCACSSVQANRLLGVVLCSP